MKMKKRTGKRIGDILFAAVLTATLLLCAVLTAVALTAQGARLQPATSAQPVSINGSYTVEGGNTWPLQSDSDFSHVGTAPVTIQGRFSREIPVNTVLFLRGHNLSVTVDVNGETLLSYGQEGTYPVFAKSPGNLWLTCVSPGITTEDTVTLTVQSAYASGGAAINELIRGLSYGSDDLLFISMLSENGAGIIIGLFVVALGLIAAVISLISFIWKLAGVKRLLFNALFVIVGGIWFLYDANYMYMSLLIPYPVFNNTIDILCMLLLPVTVTLYLRLFTSGAARKWQDGLLWLLTAATAVQAALQLAGVCDLYELQLVSIIMSQITLGLNIGCLAREWHGGNRDARRTLLSFLPMAAGSVADVICYFLLPAPARMWFRMGFLLSAAVQVVFLMLNLRDSVRASKQVQRLENELLQSRIKLLLSQIKPHFLYNSLNAISGLVLTDPQQADTAIVNFSEYLRVNLGSIESDALIRFDRELSHIDSYVALEKMRYGDRLTYICDADYTDFMVPTLSVQPLVENAIGHGMAGRERLTVRLTAYRHGGDTVIRVEDDGAGFDPEAAAADNSVGMSNVRKRVGYLCSARLEVESAPGQGCTVTITIPQNGGTD